MSIPSILFLSAFLWAGADEEFLHWNLKQAHAVVLHGGINGTVGSRFGFRGLHTERSINYKLRVTWFSPEVIRAGARIAQLATNLSDRETLRLVEEAEHAAETIVLVEIDPREGSGIVPSTWTATLTPDNESSTSSRSSKGVNTPELGQLPALSSGVKRDYNYDVFWLAFSLHATEGRPLFLPEDREAELTIRIHDEIGRVHLRVPTFDP